MGFGYPDRRRYPMRTGRPKAMLTISSDERTQLIAITRSRSLPAALTMRARIVLACEREPSNAVVATQLGVGPHTIGKWRAHPHVSQRGHQHPAAERACCGPEIVIAGLVPAIPIQLAWSCLLCRDGRDKPGHDEVDHFRKRTSAHPQPH